MTPENLIPILESMGKPRILIVGDLILDRYITGDVERISPEAPIPVLAVRQTEKRLGGAGNVAANLRSMDADVDVLGVVGDDAEGRELRSLFESIGVHADGILSLSGRPTTEKTRLLGAGAQMLRVDFEDTTDIDEGTARQLLTSVEERLGSAQAVVLSDYGKGVLTEELIQVVVKSARGKGVPVLVDPKGTDYSRYRGATLATPNKKETEVALGRKLSELALVPAGGRELMESAGLDAIVITLGADGIYFRSQHEEGRVPAMARAVFDVTGAGDTVIAQLALGLACGTTLEEAVLLANRAAGLVVGRRGAAVVTRHELRAALSERPGATNAILTRSEIAAAVAGWHAEKNRVVFTNGCFDILHAGHVSYLRLARARGDVLIVGVNDDASVKRLKGSKRPINCLEDRLQVLAALEMVTAVCPFGEDTPAELIREITPDVLVKGKDWADKGVVGREWVESHGGEVYLAPLLPGRSTTGIADRLKSD
jgi:D-beta-D-heptose 7-phosphate kinase/D-beta-D-heptose 1-phosphate adenosyltransferase